MKNHFTILHIIFSIVLHANTNAQTVLLKNTVPEDFSTIETKGANRKRYTYSYFSIGGVVSSPYYPDSTESTLARSFKISTGSTGKRQLNRYLGLLWDFEFSYLTYALRYMDSVNTLAYYPEIDRAKYYFIQINNALGSQFNFSPNRGNQLGTYLSVLGFLDYNLLSRFTTKSTISNGYKVTSKQTMKKIDFINPLSYGITVKFGKHYWDIFAKYRISDRFKGNQLELPRLIVGIELIMHNDEP